MMKKTILSCFMLSALLVPTKKAHAGLLLVETAGTAGAIIGYVLAGAGGLVMAPAMLAPRWDPVLGKFLLGGLVLIGLDTEDEQASIANISNHLANKYPKINDQSVFDDISHLVNEEYNKVAPLEKGEKIERSLSEDKLRLILNRIDHTGIESQVETLIQDLI